MENVTRDEILSMDIATHTGFFSTHESGVWNFTESKGRNDNKQHKAFRDTLKDFILKYNIKLIVAEDATCGRSPREFIAQRKLSEFRGILLEVCDTLDLPEPVFINSRTIKKWATGDGNANKAKMVEFCKKRWHIDPITDDHADAAHIFYYYVTMYKL